MRYWAPFHRASVRIGAASRVYTEHKGEIPNGIIPGISTERWDILFQQERCTSSHATRAARVVRAVFISLKAMVAPGMRPGCQAEVDAWFNLYLLQKSRIVLAVKREQQYSLLTALDPFRIPALPRISHLGLIPRAWFVTEPGQPVGWREDVAHISLLRISIRGENQATMTFLL